MSATHAARGSDAPATTSPPPSPRLPLGRPFAAQLTSTGLANLGDGLLGTLVPLLALGLTSSPAQISLLSAATWLPWLLFGLAAGVLIDRIDRRQAQITALVIRAGLLAGGAVLGGLGLLSMQLLVALTLAYGITEVVADLGATSIVPDLVPRDRLSTANGRIVAVQQVANGFLGAPLAGALVVVGAGVGLGSAAALAALAALVLLVGLRGSYRHAPAREDSPARPARPTRRSPLARPLAEVREGLSFLVHHPVVRPMVITSSVLNFASTGYFAVFILWVVGATSHVGLTEAQFPLLMLGFAAGAVGGSFLAPTVRNRFGELPTIVASLTLNSLLLLALIPVADGVLLAAVLALVGVLNSIGNVVSMALRQRIVPGELLGRVGGASRTLAYGLMPLGAIAGGLVAERWGLVATFVGAGVISFAACVYLALTVRPSMIDDAERSLGTGRPADG
ncbi:putative MFS family arabinose efflux permease [Salana multivorans]|uniref:Putative MFS family arabinose efflux permease n=1 Tax=Salana multivorans TaxID=120377 RepID=A0A3N2DB86_9MICO|nr:MFS transporter [Salana multivorans]ROR97069.1 putative MFS family arabinose efflux permease [Salana multivorans]